MVAPTIVAGIDFSEGSRRALQAVSFLARGAPMRVRLVHVFPPGKLRIAGAELRRVKATIARGESAEATDLTALAERLRKQGFDVDTVAVEGKAAATLLAQAKSHKAMLIAVGTSGRRGVEGIFLGSVAQAVLRDSPIPVLVTPTRDRQGRKRAGPVLAAVDLGPGSAAVLEAAAALAKDLGVKLHVLHCLPLPFIAMPDGGLNASLQAMTADEEGAAIDLTALVEPLRGRVAVETTVGLGDPTTHVLATALQVGAAAIVLGRRKPGRRLGSVASAVTHAADRPVLVVPAGFASRGTLGFSPAGRNA